MTFHRGHWCPWCRISINTLARAQSRIEAAGASMVAIVPDREQFAAEMKTDSKATFPILSDMDNGYAMSLNLAIWVGEEMEEFMAARGHALPKYQGNDSWMLPIPGDLRRRRRTAASRRASSIRIIASAWRSRI